MKPKAIEPTQKSMKRALTLLAEFEKFPPYYRHGSDNVHLRRLAAMEYLPVAAVVRFFNAWRPLSRYQPQLLLLMASLFTEVRWQKEIVEGNAREEGGYKRGHDPHWVLLDRLITKLGGRPASDSRTERLMAAFLDSLRRPMTEAEAAGILAGIENPALDITAYFREIIRCAGFTDLNEDLYLKLHVAVEPLHIVQTHEMALSYMDQGRREREEVLRAFEHVMTFWSEFWDTAFDELFTPQPIAA